MIHTGDALTVLRTLPDASVQCVVTSPPYWGLRDYKVKGQIGLEPTPEAYVARLVEVFREVRRVLVRAGTLWLNLGDSYATGGGKVGNCPGGGPQGAKYRGDHGPDPKSASLGPQTQPNRMPIQGLKPKDLVGIPWRVAFALQADGWYLRSDIIWHKPNPMPESVTDRPTKAHEYVFLLAKSERYYYDGDAVRERAAYIQANSPQSIASPHGQGFTRRALAYNRSGNKTKTWGNNESGKRASGTGCVESHRGIPFEGSLTRNRRNVWTVSTMPYKGAHFATFPPKLIEPCILAGAPQGAVVLDPFAGAGTTGLVAAALGREFIGIELNAAYVKLAAGRLAAAA